jgi:hypothetical protein
MLVAALFFGRVSSSHGQQVQHLNITQPGGMPAQPLVTDVIPGTNRVGVTWSGPPGYYQLFEKQSLSDPVWHALSGRTNLARRAVVSGASSNALFRVLGPAPRFVGAQACTECHQSTHDSEIQTRHAQAFAALQQIHQDQNPSCLPCHTVGYGAPTGFSSASATPHLAGVQCENCHGAAGNHAANPDDPSVVPLVDIAAQVCGGCHNGSHQPTFSEWQSSPHSTVVEDMNPTNRIDSCGRCHSGSARLALIEGEPLPVGDANIGVVCVTCHDPHDKTTNPAQLRNPTYSTNDYYLTTTDVFTNKYNPDINVCGQCHNHRGAAWTSSGRAPHHSPQYNILLGTVGVLPSGALPNQPASHGLLIKNQCAGCHMQSTNFVSETQPAITGHNFQVQAYDMCRACHPFPQELADFTTGTVSNAVQNIKAALDLWAVTKAPTALRDKYGTRAWEYTIPGDLSPGGTGPTATEQKLIPVNIQKARFNLYLVLYDGSFGVHNAPFASTLLESAEGWVDLELKP